MQRDPTESGVCACVSDLEFSEMRRSWSCRGCCAVKIKYETLFGQIEVKKYLLSFGAEYFVLQFSVPKI